VALRAAVHARKDLVAHRVAVANQLRAHVQTAFPGAVGLFADLDSPTSLAFLTRFDCHSRADWLSPKRLAAWLSSISYSGRTDPTVRYARLTGAPRGATGEHGARLAHLTRTFVTLLHSLVDQIKALSTQIGDQLAAHANAHIVTSLPRSGAVRAARLLAEIGDCRARFPDAESLIGLAGAAFSTRQSGKHQAVTFRWALDKQLRDAICDFAADSRHAHPWPPSSTTTPSPAAKTTPTPPASSPAPGSPSSGAAGTTTPPMTRPNTEPSNTRSTKINKRRLDTGLLIYGRQRPETAIFPGSVKG
jgi:transposase